MNNWGNDGFFAGARPAEFILSEANGPVFAGSEWQRPW